MTYQYPFEAKIGIPITRRRTQIIDADGARVCFVEGFGGDVEDYNMARALADAANAHGLVLGFSEVMLAEARKVEDEFAAKWPFGYSQDEWRKRPTVKEIWRAIREADHPTKEDTNAEENRH